MLTTRSVDVGEVVFIGAVEAQIISCSSRAGLSGGTDLNPNPVRTE